MEQGTNPCTKRMETESNGQIEGFFRRPLPCPPATSFASESGKQMFREAMDEGNLEIFFCLSQAYSTQVEPAYCGLSSLAMALNALGIDPLRTWKVRRIHACSAVFTNLSLLNEFRLQLLFSFPFFFCLLGRAKKGPWRWFSESLFDCWCVHFLELNLIFEKKKKKRKKKRKEKKRRIWSMCVHVVRVGSVDLERVKEVGVTLLQVACLARCNGATTETKRAGSEGIHDSELAGLCVSTCQGIRIGARDGETTLKEAVKWEKGSFAEFESDVRNSCRSGERVVICSYSRRVLGQTGDGHFSPIGGYNEARKEVLLLDVARFKYPPHWCSIETVYEAMLSVDGATGHSRGWLILSKHA